MGTFTFIHHDDIDAPASEVWEVVADYRRDPEWRTGVVTMAPDPAGPVVPRTTTLEELRIAGCTMHNEGLVLSVEPGTRFDWRTTAGARAEGSRTVTHLGPGRCRLELRLVVTPTGAERLLAPILRRMLDRNLVGDLARLKALVERTPADLGAS